MKENYCTSIPPLLVVFVPRNKRASKILMQQDYQQIWQQLEGQVQQFDQPPVRHLQPTGCNHCKMEDLIYLTWQNQKISSTNWCLLLHVNILSAVFQRQTHISTTMAYVTFWF
jgi:hypothetical protein